MKIRRNYIGTYGEIESFRKGRKPTDDGYYRDTLLNNVAYYTKIGEKYYHKFEKGYGEKVGDKIMVHYEVDYPNNSLIYSSWKYEMKPIIIIVIGVILFLIGISTVI